jgi:hypothetical protein
MKVPAAPVSQVVLGRWFPAEVVLPRRPVWHRVYVLCTDAELCVWGRPDDTPEWMSPLTKTPTLPVDERTARNGFDIRTKAGLVVVTLGTGCRCGRLGRWPGPTWARYERTSR